MISEIFVKVSAVILLVSVAVVLILGIGTFLKVETLARNTPINLCSL